MRLLKLILQLSPFVGLFASSFYGCTDFLICCDNFIGVTLKERVPNSAGTLVDVGLNKVWLHSFAACIFASLFFVLVTDLCFGLVP